MDKVKLVRNGIEKEWPAKDLARLKLQGWKDTVAPVESVEAAVVDPKTTSPRKGPRK